MSIASEIQRIIGGKSSLKTGLNAILPTGHKITDSETIDEYSSHLQHIQTGSGGGETSTIDVTINGSSAIICAELPNTKLKLYNSAETLLDTKITDATKGGVVTFSVSANGTYTIKAFSSDDTELWTNTITISEVGTYNVKTGKALNDYTWAEINTASTQGYARFMWSLGDYKTLEQTGSILNNYQFIIIGFRHDVLASDGTTKAGITFKMKKYYTGSTYNINPMIYLNGSSTYRNTGGLRSSLMRQRFQAQGEECYSQASSITAELLASGLIYADGTNCPLYSYDEETDTYSVATSETFNTSKVYHIKGCYKSIGQIEEADFVVGKHLTYSSNGYKIPSAWVSGTTYYCIYPTLQEDGAFYNALSSIIQYIKPVKKTQTCGNAKTNLCTTIEKVWMLCAEEIWGENRTTQSDQGLTMTGAGFYNGAGEGNMYDYFKDFRFGKIASANSYWWTRSPGTYNYNSWNYVSNSGYISNSYVYNNYYVCPCFCI